MRFATLLGCALALAGCGQLFGLDQPILRSDAAVAPSDAPPDERGLDARPDAMQLVCPSNYLLTISATTSKYRLIATAGGFGAQSTDCNNDSVGSTHLASPETQAEIDGYQTLISARAYVGAVQQPNSPTIAGNWFTFSGTVLPATAWDPTNPVQPDDQVTAGEGNEENIASLDPTGLHDLTGDGAFPALCECDGHPIDPTVATYVP